MAIAPDEKLTLVYCTHPATKWPATGVTKASFSLRRSLERYNADTGVRVRGVHVGIESSEMTMEEWARTFEHLAREIREWNGR